jgi:hypothetical protein
MSETPDTPQFIAPSAPTPADMPQEAPAETPAAKPTKTLEELETELAKTRHEAAGYRHKIKELEPLAKKAQAADEAQKSDVQKAEERAQAAEQREKATLEGYTQLELAVQYSIPPEDIKLIGSGTREEMDANAKRLAALHAAAAKAERPPTDRPVEGLRPGATPEPAKSPDDSYPAAWTPPYMRDKDNRSFYGQ